MAKVIPPDSGWRDNGLKAATMIDAESAIRDIIAAHPATVEVFERYGIEFCCSGAQTLAAACQAAGASTAAVLASLRESEAENTSGQADQWESATLRQIIGFIRHHHHEYARRAIQEIRGKEAQVLAGNGAGHPELEKIAAIFNRMAQEMLFHLAKEEHGLFPRIERLESLSRGEALPAAAPARGHDEATIRVMMDDHGASAAMMKEIRGLSGNFTAPEDADAGLKRWYRQLAEFERDLRRHVHLENNILFPRALLLEEELRLRPRVAIEPPA